MPDMHRHLIAALAALLLAGCVRYEPPAAGTPAAPGGSAAPVTLMTFNVENLFDARDDPDRKSVV